MTPEEFKAEVDYIRSRGVDGWIIWAYGGPGVEGYSVPDIRPFLGNLTLPTSFILTDVKFTTTENSATITWTTSLPTTSKIEFSTFSLFNASWKLWNDFHYWEIYHVNGTIIENSTSVTNHSITLTNLMLGTQYYFRVQSQDSSGIAISKVLTFNLSRPAS
jgi:hypothetical protein